jgi:hypothetical protein
MMFLATMQQHFWENVNKIQKRVATASLLVYVNLTEKFVYNEIKNA